MTARDELLDLLMTMQAQHQDPETVGDLVDWLIRRRAEAARDQHEASVRLLELGGWWQLVRASYADFGRDVFVSTLLEAITDEARP